MVCILHRWMFSLVFFLFFFFFFVFFCIFFALFCFVFCKPYDLSSCLILSFMLWWFNVMLGLCFDPLSHLSIGVYPSVYIHFGAAPLLSGPLLVTWDSLTFCFLTLWLFCCILSPRFIGGKTCQVPLQQQFGKRFSFSFFFSFFLLKGNK